MAGLPTDPNSTDPFSRYVSPETMRWTATGRQIAAHNVFGSPVTRIEEVRTRFSPSQGWHQETRFRRARGAELVQTRATSVVEPASDIFDTSAPA